MRKIITTTFITLDGVMQAPGGRDEDKEGGFAYGGWQTSFPPDEKLLPILSGFFTIPFELLLGKTTYDIFAGYWPKHADEPHWGKPYSKAKKYVVSHKPTTLSWDNSELITGDVVEEIKKLKINDLLYSEYQRIYKIRI